MGWMTAFSLVAIFVFLAVLWRQSKVDKEEVEAVDAEYFQGYCHKAGETRTFLIARVRGEVLVLGYSDLVVDSGHLGG